MKHKIQLTINDELYEVSVEPYKTLIDIIRDDIGLIGTKKGCGTGYCVSCTIILDCILVNFFLILVVYVDVSYILTFVLLRKVE